MKTTVGRRSKERHGLCVFFALTAGVLTVPLVTVSVVGQDKKGAEIRVESRQNGGRVSLTIGDSLVITLPAQPGTGYGWRVADVSSRIVQLQSNIFQQGDGLPSGYENQILTFFARETGKGVLTLNYSGPGDTAAPGVTPFQLSVTVD